MRKSLTILLGVMLSGCFTTEYLRQGVDALRRKQIGVEDKVDTIRDSVDLVIVAYNKVEEQNAQLRKQIREGDPEHTLPSPAPFPSGPLADLDSVTDDILEDAYLQESILDVMQEDLGAPKSQLPEGNLEGWCMMYRFVIKARDMVKRTVENWMPVKGIVSGGTQSLTSPREDGWGLGDIAKILTAATVAGGAFGAGEVRRRRANRERDDEKQKNSRRTKRKTKRA